MSILFNNYLQGHLSLEDLVDQLQRIEDQLKQEKPEAGLWFKFSQDDSLATTISDLEKDLSDNRNREFAKERMREAINLDNELFIYYS